MKVFRSQLEDILPAKELRFNPTPGFEGYKRYLSHAIAHPAKINMKMLKFLIQNFTVEGDVVLDPMAGSGSTGVVASLNGRNAVCVDIEEKFHKWMEQAREKVMRQKTFTRKGWIKNVCGDARKLSQLLREVDVVVTSPPYSDISKPGNIKNPISKEEFEKRKKEGDHSVYHDIRPERKGTLYEYYEMVAIEKYGSSSRNIDRLPHGSVDAIVTSPPYSESEHDYKHGLKKLGDNFKGREAWEKRRKIEVSDKNLAKLPHGKVDAVITSPPYGESYLGGGDSEKRKERLEKAGHDPKDFLGGKARNAVLKHYPKVDAVITSPPYAKTDPTTFTKRHIGNREEPRSEYVKQEGYSDKKENIGNLRFQPDVVITSPPYQHDSVVHKNRSGETKVAKEKFGYSDFYSSSQKNIGNLKRETYLEAMLKVYCEMFKVLKPQGKAIIVIKPFIRNKKVVDLPYHTWLLLKKAGFKLVQLFKLRLKQESFWRILYSKKYPNVPKIKHEYILVTEK